jgi:hypothetical protein
MAEDEAAAGPGDEGGGAPAETLDPDLAEQIAGRWDPEKMLGLVSQRSGRASALDMTLRNRYERKLGVDLSHVRIFTGELAEDMNKAYNSHAVTVGNTGMIMMGGTKSMETAEGQALLAHELTHVAQSQRGIMRDARFGDDMLLATAEHEAEADAMEAGELAELQGGGGGGGEDDAEEGNQEMTAKVIEKVLDMLGERGRIMLMRGGPFARRA